MHCQCGQKEHKVSEKISVFSSTLSSNEKNPCMLISSGAYRNLKKPGG